MADFTKNTPDSPPSEPSGRLSLEGLNVEAGLAAAYGQLPERDVTRDQQLRSFYQRGALIADKFRLIELIGEGGMGTVWFAEQFAPVKRRVALKLIKPGLDSRSVLARFDAERQALALMDHPNIAKVFDGGITDQGHPFFVMELVKGTSLTTFCDERRLDLNERLELFIGVCQAIQHAHQKGVIHRDIKPSNIMVALYDGKPVPKVIDFGVAKAIGTALTDQSLHTDFGAVVGTAEYMSPEQAELNNLDIDTRSDVYSLGVLMYELLAGSPPFPRDELNVKGLHEVLRVIREVDPQRPSAKLSTSKRRASIAALRGIEPEALGKMLRGDLDWIVMKSLEKDRSRRYESPLALARDLDRYLRDEPVDASPPSAQYRIRKFLRRYRWQTLGGSLLLTTLIAGIVGTSWGFYRAESQRRVAVQAQTKLQQQKELAEEAESATLESYRASTDDAIEQLIGSKTHLSHQERKYLENALVRWQAFADKSGEDARGRTIRAEAHFRLGKIWISLGQAAEARIELERAEEFYRQLITEFPEVLAHRSNAAKCKRALGTLLISMGETETGKGHLVSAQTINKSLVNECPAVVEYRLELGYVGMSLAAVQGFLGKTEDAELQYRQALSVHEKLVAEFPARSELRNHLATTQCNFASWLHESRKFAEAEERYLAALTEFERLAREFPDSTSLQHQLAACHRMLGFLLRVVDRLEAAEKHLLSAASILEPLVVAFPALPEYQTDLATTLNALGTILMQAERWDEAELFFRRCVIISEQLAARFKLEPSYRVKQAESYYDLALQLKKMHRSDEAEKLYRQAIEIEEDLARQQPLIPTYLSNLAKSQNSLAILLLEAGELAEAEIEYRKALAIREQLHTDFPKIIDHTVELGGSYCNLGQFLRDSGKVTESIDWFDRAIAILQPVHAIDTRAVGAKNYLRNAHWGRAKAQLLLGKFSESDWNLAIELSPDDRQSGFQLRKFIAQFRSGESNQALADLPQLHQWLAKTPVVRLKADEWFDLACVLSSATHRVPEQSDALLELSIEMLRNAVQTGFTDRQRLLEDPKLEPTRSHSQFGELIKSLSH